MVDLLPRGARAVCVTFIDKKRSELPACGLVWFRSCQPKELGERTSKIKKTSEHPAKVVSCGISGELAGAGLSVSMVGLRYFG